MKFAIITILILFASVHFSSGQYFRGLDRSPMDIAYFPDNFAHDRKPDDKAIIRVIYSRPQRKGRELFGSLVPFGEVWRTGANEATEIKFYREISLNGQSIDPGTYSLFTIPGDNEWIIILNSDLDYWGSYSYQEENDVARISAKLEEIDQNVEPFTIQFEQAGPDKGIMQMAWGTTLVEIPFEY
jgi:hypothetical protein